jgi:hypothetical protein
MGGDMLAGQNGTTTGFGAAAHTNGNQDEDEQTEPEEAVSCWLHTIGFFLLTLHKHFMC